MARQKTPPPLTCPRCGSMGPFRRAGSVLSPRGRVQRYQCACGKKFHRSLRAVPMVLREGYLDIEASQLKASFGIVYSWAIKTRGGEVESDVIRHHSLQGERRLLGALIRALKKYDMIYTYNGTLFDIPFLRTRALRHGLEFPEYMEVYHTDLYFVAKHRLRMHSNRLEAITKFLRIDGKTPLDPDIWVRASFGDKKALREILVHNIGDVVVLEKVHERLEPYYAGTRRSI